VERGMNHADISRRFVIAMQACGLCGQITVRDERGVAFKETTEWVGKPSSNDVIVRVILETPPEHAEQQEAIR